MKILLFLGNQILSQGLRRIVSDVLPEAILADQFSLAAPIEPDLVLFDSHEDVNLLQMRHPGAKFICLDLGLTESEIACLIFVHGVKGIIPPRLDAQMLGKALLAVHHGEVWIGHDYLGKAMRQQNLADTSQVHALSAQDRKIVAMIVDGRRNSEIADALCLSESTIKNHVSRIYKTLKVKNRAQLAHLATLKD